jgi:DNA-binding transcriptional LysR family regulator
LFFLHIKEHQDMTINLRSVDLNLLVVLEALVEERSVARAAARIGLTPSAVSHALRRLRVTVGDELLVRRGPIFEPTPHAARLLATMGPALDQIAIALDLPRDFDPGTAHRNFHLGVSDYVGEYVLPRLCSYIAQVAPDVSLSILPLDDRKAADVVAYEGVELHLSIHGEAGIVRPVQTQLLFEDTFMVLMRKDHPMAGRPLVLDDYLGLKHIKVTGLGSAIDNRLAQLGLVRRIMVKVPNWQSVLSIVESTDMVALIPRHWTRRPQFRNRFSSTPLPLDDFYLSIDAIWHPRNEYDSGHRWFRNVIMELFGEMQTSR